KLSGARHGCEPLDEKRHRASAVREDHPHIRITRGRPTENDLGDRTSCVGSPLDRPFADIRKEISAATGSVRMRVNDGITPVEFLENRIERGIAEPLVAIAGEQPDAVRLERIEGVLDLAEAGIDVGQRTRSEYPESPRMVRRQSRRVLVAFPAKADGRRAAAKGVAGWRNRTDSRGNAGPV